MATTLNSTQPILPMPQVDFTWDPVGASVIFNFTGNSYPPAGARFAAFYTPVNQLITFTASTKAATGTAIVQYRWDMGDGVTKFGAIIGHTYVVPNPSLTAKLEITDSLGRKVYVAKALLLQVQFPTTVSNKARV